MFNRWEQLKNKVNEFNSPSINIDEFNSPSINIDEMWNNIYDNYSKEYVISQETKDAIKFRMNQIIDDLLYTDPENGITESFLEEIHQKMILMNWKWCDKIPETWEILKCLENEFERCFEVMKEELSFYIGTGGWIVHVNVLNRTVEVFFSIFDSTIIDYDE